MKPLTLAIAASLLLAPGAVQAAGDPAAGAMVFKKCMVCHAAGEGAKNRVGPVLSDVVGRVAGTYPGFSYSAAMKKAGADGITWTPENLNTYLTDPKAFVPGNKMAFPGLKEQADRDNVIAYLISVSPGFVPAAAPAAAAAPAQ